MGTSKAEHRLRECKGKIEALARSTDAIAHQLNNALTVITGTIDLLGDAVRDEPQLAGVAKLIAEAAQRGSRLTQQLFALRGGCAPLRMETEINADVSPTVSRVAAGPTPSRQEQGPESQNAQPETKMEVVKLRAS